MKYLLHKEFRLALHPTNVIFLFLSAMLLIPAYPYLVVFFYTALGAFFLCLNGRETGDIEYTALLPVRKRDAVAARMLTVTLTELAQAATAVPFAVLHFMLTSGDNTAGMNPNAAFFGFALGMLGLFNLVFFPRWYKNPDKVGLPFFLGSAAVTVWIFGAEALMHVLPFAREVLNARAFSPWQALVLAAGGALFALFTLAAYRRSAARFETIDL